TSVCTHGETAGTVPYLIGSIPALDAGSGVAGPRPAQARMIGRYLCTPDVCVALREVANRQGLPVDLIAALRLLAERQALAAHPYPGRWWDCGCRSGFVAATLEMAGEDPGLGPALWSRLRLAP
ncbi:MAG TPA: hypothetical protein VMW75_03670, partial [Thermoanaerobaculia bacterium]|nr:hypothetical protein [Thermoanaerobaculia bacterium]